jgi:hypothetical protein
VAVAGALAMISFGFMMAARFASEELANGAINLASWPMMLLSGVWFSLEGRAGMAAAGSQGAAAHPDAGSRARRHAGRGQLRRCAATSRLAGGPMTLLFLGIAASGFRWRAD